MATPKKASSVIRLLLGVLILSSVFMNWINLDLQCQSPPGYAVRFFLGIKILVNGLGEGYAHAVYVYGKNSSEMLLTVEADLSLVTSLIVVSSVLMFTSAILRLPWLYSALGLSRSRKLRKILIEFDVLTCLSALLLLVATAYFFNGYPQIKLTLIPSRGHALECNLNTLCIASLTMVCMFSNENYGIGHVTFTPGFGAVFAGLLAVVLMVSWVATTLRRVVKLRKLWLGAVSLLAMEICSLAFPVAYALVLSKDLLSITSTLTKECALTTYVTKESLFLRYVSEFAQSESAIQVVNLMTCIEIQLIVILSVFCIMMVMCPLITHAKYSLTTYEYLSLYLPPDEYRRRLRILTKYWLVSSNMWKVVMIISILLLVCFGYLIKKLWDYSAILTEGTKAIFGEAFYSYLLGASVTTLPTFIIAFFAPLGTLLLPLLVREY